MSNHNGVRVTRTEAERHALAGAHDAARDLTAVGDKDTLEGLQKKHVSRESVAVR